MFTHSWGRNPLVWVVVWWTHFLKKASYQASLLFNTLNNFFLNNSIFSAATISISHPLESPPVGNQTDAVGTAAGQSDAGVGNRPA